MNSRYWLSKVLAIVFCSACILVSVRGARAADLDIGSSIAGTVVDHDGRPIAGATVRIAYAWVRVGNSPYCPSCWADCGKTATTDSAGQFAIKSLDQRLVFRALFIDKGYEPTFAEFDPQEHKPLQVTLKSRQALPKDPRQILSGRVVDSRGKPVVAALVVPIGGKDGEERWFGGAKWTGIDPLAVTDEAGQFEIVSGHSADTFDLEVTARALAKKNFALVPTAKTDNRLVMTEGATVRGRVVDHGRPVPNVSVGMVQTDRRAGVALGPLEIGTDANGEFLFANVPPNRDYHIYGIMDSLRDRGGISERQIHVGGDGSETKIADLAVEPAYRISGRLVLSDGKPVPPHTRIHIGRHNAADAQIIDVDSSGAFTARGIPPGLISLHAPLDGYRMSNKNLSFEPLNATFLQGLVEKDIDGLVVLLEPGERRRIDPESRTQDDWRKIELTEQRIKLQPLTGALAVAGGYKDVEDLTVERPLHPSKPLPKIELPPPLPKPVSADANVPKRPIVGQVVDPAGKPVAGADVWYQVRRDAAPGEFTVHAKSDTDGRYKLEFPIEWLPKTAPGLNAPPIVLAYAPGYAIGAGNAMSQAISDWVGLFPEWASLKLNHATPLEIQLGPQSDAEFTVLTPDGVPLAGARVGLPSDVCPPNLVAKTCGTTDNHGRARMSVISPDKPNQAVQVMVEAAGYGSQDFLLFGPHANSWTLQLAPVGRIEGQVVAAQPELFRGMRVSITTEPKIVAAKHQKDMRCSGQADLYVDAQGRFVVPEIATGRIKLRAQIADERLPVRPRVIEPNQVSVVPGQTTRIEIPMEMLVKVHGLIRVKETGKPVADAAIVVHSDHFSLRDKVSSDPDGRYTARVLPGDVNLEVIGPVSKDFRQSRDSQEAHYDVPDDATDFELPVVEIEKCKNVAGLLLDKKGTPAGTSVIYAFAGEKMYFVVAWKQGEFEFRDVPEGTLFDRFQVGSGGPNPREVPVTIQSKDPLVLRLK